MVLQVELDPPIKCYRQMCYHGNYQGLQFKANSLILRWLGVNMVVTNAQEMHGEDWDQYKVEDGQGNPMARAVIRSQSKEQSPGNCLSCSVVGASEGAPPLNADSTVQAESVRVQGHILPTDTIDTYWCHQFQINECSMQRNSTAEGCFWRVKT
jgi:hypothetical protein